MKKKLRRLYDVFGGENGDIVLGDSDLASDAERGELTSPVDARLLGFPLPFRLDISLIDKHDCLVVDSRQIEGDEEMLLEANCFFLQNPPIKLGNQRNSRKSTYLISLAYCEKYA